MTRLLTLAAVAALAIAPAAIAQDSAPAEWPAIGSSAPQFSLPDLLDESGTEVALADVIGESDFAVLIWNSITCPYCIPYDADLPGMAAEYEEQGVQFIGINSNVTEDPADVTSHLSDAGFNYPVLRDEGNVVADAYGATRTPEVYVVDSSGALRYHGRIDDSPRDRDNVQSTDLRNALDALVAGGEPPVATTNAVGCTIKRVDM